MICTIDIGNSNIVTIIYDENKKRVFDSRHVTIKEDIEEGYRRYVEDVLIPLKEKYQYEAIIISSVVPSVNDTLFGLIKKNLEVELISLKADLLPELNVELDNPSEIGADFIASMYGALARYKGTIILVDMGSATKISVFNDEYTFHGGVIMPGLKISQEALNSYIPHLPVVPLEIPESAIGKDTISAIQSGLMYSNLEAIEGISRRIDAEFKTKTTYILTGGLSSLFHNDLPKFIYEPFILNEGLYEIYYRLKKAI